ncbi:hypothetical protein [Aurantiacibacter rhizosphaerae]|uniref:Uncharacterized protein n=1 Tax=Aurantiacibacter rhizosphaerae TaxID=2691582 RepID=A0A844XE91_9SPHN|nr:hypothetical protein [Aurantiacibacter rhizosphaerae]MWV28079.1 hypothetical protein [Aurantiacibacter rhizosphaerae]
MARQRDYKAEYQRRIANAAKRGLSKSQARGHARPGEKPIRGSNVARGDTKLEAALTALRQSGTQVAAAKEAGVSVERFRRFLRENQLAERQGRTWLIDDRAPREMLVLSNGQAMQMRLDGYEQASLNGRYLSAFKSFISTNDSEFLSDFVGLSVRDAKGKLHPFETDENALYRLAASGSEIFEDIYRLITI